MAAEAMCLEGRLALEMHPLDTPPDPETITLSQQHNLDCLKQAILLDELSHLGIDDHLAESSDLSRTEKKLDLLLSLVKSLIEKQHTPSLLTQVRLTTDFIEWRCDKSGADSTRLICLFLPSGSLLPMQLYIESASYHEGRCRARVLHMCEAVHEQLEKYIFLRHRRKIAAKKNSTV